MKRRDIASGAVLAGVGILVTQQARHLTYRDEFGPGPGLLPYWLGLILTALGACLVIFAFRGSSGTEEEFPKNSSSVPKLPRVLLAWLGLVGTVAALEVLGFVLSLGLLSFFLIYVVERRSLSRAITVAVAITVCFLLLFRVILPVPLPLNPWGF